MTTIEQIKQYLTFELAEERYGIGVKSIKEILEIQRITSMPRTAEHLLGVMNVRGRVVPVVDLRLKLGLAKAEETVDSAIIVLEISDNGTETLMGLLVDNVDEVLELEPESVEPAPKVGTTVDGQLLSGIAKREERFILLLNTDEVFSDEDLEIAEKGVQDSDGEQLVQPA